MAARRAHLVGSLPGPDPRTAMTNALAVLGPYLRSLPDGETGVRNNWVQAPIEGLRHHPDLELLADPDLLPGRGRPGQDHNTRLRVRRGHRLFGASLDFGHVAAAADTYPLFEELTAGRDDLVFQQGLPGPFDMAALTLGPAGGLRQLRAFTEATLTEIRDIRRIAGPSTLFQIEVPLELVLLARAPAPARRPLARLLARNVTRLAAAAPTGTRFAVHLCVGDQDHRALVTPGDVTPLVLLANEIVDQWPHINPLVLLHAPSRQPNFPPAPKPLSSHPCATSACPPRPRSPPASLTRRRRSATRCRFATGPRTCWGVR